MKYLRRFQYLNFCFQSVGQLGGCYGSDIVEFLLLKGADPTAKDGKGKTAKSVAAKKGYDDVAKMIKKAIKEKREEESDSD